MEERIVFVDPATLSRVRAYLDESAEGFRPQGALSCIRLAEVSFGEYDFEVRCCGCDEESSWLEALLLKHGVEVSFSDPEFDDPLGVWELEADGKRFEVTIEAGPATSA